MEKTTKSSLVLNEEPMIRWTDEADINMDDTISISSEEETGSEYDSEQRARTKPGHEIWDVETLWTELMALPDAEEVNNLILKEDLENTLKADKSTVLLLSSCLGKTNVLNAILNEGVSVNCTDNSGRSALHLAAYAGRHDCLKLLVERGADVNVWDERKQVTPLHCAAATGHLSCLRLLVKHGADVNAGLKNNRSPLHYAVQSLAVDCVRELLENNASPNTPQVFSETPLHVAAGLGNSKALRLLLEYGAAINVQCGPDRMTPLHLASEDGDAECARLLLDAGALVNTRNRKNQTALHLAALSQCSETLELLLGKGADPNVPDADGRTPLHSSIVKVTIKASIPASRNRVGLSSSLLQRDSSQIVSRSCECVRLLLNAGAAVNKPDAFGYTPLHLAALNEFSHCVMLLINYGGDVTLRTNGGISVLTFITRKTPDVIPKYIEKFDSSIKLNDHELGDVDCELKLDFRVMVPTMGNKETELLLNFIEVGYKPVLKHPLCETFLFLKWRRIRKFFLFSLFYHAIFVLLFTVYVIGVYLKDCPSSKSRNTLCWVPDYVKNIGYVLILLNSLLLGKELFQVAHAWVVYLKEWENWLQWTIIISVFCCVQPVHNMDVKEDVYEWQHHVAAISIFLSWVELMMIVGRFPIFGLYIQMFTTVSVNFGKFMLAYICLFVAFALSFGVIFANYPAFRDLKWVLLKVIIMMSGELEYEDVFFTDGYPLKYPFTAHLMYFCFVLLMTVILNNLMVGLAVSDIQGLQQSAGLDRLVRQAELVAHLESILFSRLLSFMPANLMLFFHRKALLLKSQYQWALYIKPNDPREERIPKELIRSIYQLVVERKERPKSRKGKRYKSSGLDVISPSLSRIGSCNSTTDINANRNNVLKAQLDEMSREFQEYSKFFRMKMEKLSNQVVINSQKQC
ncbi:hypothetical protein NQ318_004037 [Aromia moschata]|uniref:Ion transport domain-containing protein n=1 Tax=Aromia moschata TaxID=1265417 RepID=A0AAV8ZAC9_9CUCU|nr:hypothetical protein NQ318_004037 [Aromia moschata]